MREIERNTHIGDAVRSSRHYCADLNIARCPAALVGSPAALVLASGMGDVVKCAHGLKDLGGSCSLLSPGCWCAVVADLGGLDLLDAWLGEKSLVLLCQWRGEGIRVGWWCDRPWRERRRGECGCWIGRRELV